MLIGRRRELEVLADAAARAGRGAGSLCALVGEAGIGKTRLADEIAARCAADGFGVSWGRAWETGGAPAYWPWRQVLEAILAADPSLPLRPQLAPLLARHERPAPGEAALSDPVEARFALSEAVAAFLRAAAQRAPLLVVLDDLHAADTPSLELLHFVARGLRASRLLLVATWRDAEARLPAVSDPIGRISREATVLRLAPLTPEEVDALIAAAPAPLTPAARRALHDRTEGNPLFVHEALRLLEEDAGGGRLSALPEAEGVAAVVRGRCARLSPEARAVARAAAVLGREPRFDLLAELSGLPLPALEAQLAALGTAGLLVRRGAERIFSHVLLRDAIYEETPPAERRALHAAAAKLLARRAEVEEGLRAAAAHHALAALPDLPLDEVTGLVLAAAAHARAQRAYEDAVALLERARAALALALPAPLEAEVELALGWAAAEAGRAELGREAFRRAAALARRAADARLLARAALGYGAEFVLGEVREDLVALLREALAGLDPTEVALGARLRARLSAALVPGPDTRWALAQAREAVAAALHSDDDRTVIEVALGAGSALADFVPPAERIPVNEALVHRARRTGDRVLELRGLSRLVTDFLEVGDVARADATLPVRDELARALRLPRYQWQTPLFRSMRAMIEGRFAECDAAVAEARELAREAGDPNADRCITLHRFGLLLLADRVDELGTYEPTLLRSVATMAGGDVFRAELSAVLRVRCGDLDGARLAVAQVQASEVALHGAHSVANFAEAVAALGHAPLARGMIERLRPHADTNSVSGLFSLLCALPVAASIAQLEAVLGDLEAAERGFAAALERSRAMGATAHEAWVRLHWARAIPDRAAEMLPEAEALADAIGAVGLVARIRAARPTRPAPPPVPSPAAGPIAFRLTLDGDGWRLERGGRTHTLRPLRGLAMLARLIEQPGRELHATELVAAATGQAEPPEAADAGEVIDDQARAAYRQRLATLREALEEAQALGRVDEAERVHEEIEALSRELARAVGLGGRARRAGSTAERARITAQRRVREAIRKISELDQELGTHLDWAIRTGSFCIYDPDARHR